MAYVTPPAARVSEAAGAETSATCRLRANGCGGRGACVLGKCVCEADAGGAGALAAHVPWRLQRARLVQSAYGRRVVRQGLRRDSHCAQGVQCRLPPQWRLRGRQVRVLRRSSSHCASAPAASATAHLRIGDATHVGQVSMCQGLLRQDCSLRDYNGGADAAAESASVAVRLRAGWLGESVTRDMREVAAATRGESSVSSAPTRRSTSVVSACRVQRTGLLARDVQPSHRRSCHGFRATDASGAFFLASARAKAASATAAALASGSVVALKWLRAAARRWRRVATACARRVVWRARRVRHCPGTAPMPASVSTRLASAKQAAQEQRATSMHVMTACGGHGTCVRGVCVWAGFQGSGCDVGDASLPKPCGGIGASPYPSSAAHPTPHDEVGSGHQLSPSAEHLSAISVSQSSPLKPGPTDTAAEETSRRRLGSWRVTLPPRPPPRRHPRRSLARCSAA